MKNWLIMLAVKLNKYRVPVLNDKCQILLLYLVSERNS